MKSEILELKKEVTGLQDRLDALLKKAEEPKFKSGWYKIPKYPKWVMYYDFDKQIRFGVDQYGEWHDTHILSSFMHLIDKSLSAGIPATKEEIESALINEAKRRGFKVGVKFHPVNSTTDSVMKELNYTIEKDEALKLTCNNVLCWDGNLFCNGVWAEIIKDETIKIDRYDVVFHVSAKPGTSHTTIDGHVFPKSFWTCAKEVAEHSKACVNVGCYHQFKVSLETINKILAKL